MKYFDYNATYPILPEAKQKWLDAVERFAGNPSSQHRYGLRADTALSNAREDLAYLIGCHPLDIIWTSGATEACNTIIHHFYRTLPESKRIWISAIEHPAVMEPVKYYFKNRYSLIPVNKDGVVSVDWIFENLKKETPGAVAVMAVNNETGVIQPVKKIIEICRDFKIPYFCDASQWVGKLPIKWINECDYFCAGGHKFGAPAGTGFIKCKGFIEPFILGGHQENGRRAGTENVAGIVGMVEAIKTLESVLAKAGVMWQADELIQPEYQIESRKKFERKIEENIPDVQVVGKNVLRVWNTVMMIMPELNCKMRWVVKLDKLGFAVSTGSACSSGSEKPSYVLTGMGFSANEASRAIRCSGGWDTKEEDWIKLADAIIKVYAEGIKEVVKETD